jgi:hypothetical protein
MKKTLLSLLALAAVAAFAAACQDPQPQTQPNYGATRRDANKAQHGLDNASGD